MKVLAALSGGVDSTVAAAMLLEAGHEVVGVTMKLWGGDSDTGCCSVSDVEDARRAAAQLGVDHHVFNFADEFDRHVVDPYVADHLVGRTPNPCIECNRHLKFDLLLRRADLLGFDLVATGHHARVVELADGSRRLARGRDSGKDQSYVLYPLAGAALQRVLLPVGETTKDKVRELASSMGLRTASKPDSQDVCFITRSDGRAAFLSERATLHPGRVVDSAGEEVGRVDAVELVTIGQRRGLDLAGGKGRRFVTDVDVARRTVTVGGATDLLVDSVDLVDLVWAGDPVEGPVEVQCSAHGGAASATVTPGAGPGPDGAVAEISWHEPHRRIAPGQSVVLYRIEELRDGDREAVVVGGGMVGGGMVDSGAAADSGGLLHHAESAGTCVADQPPRA
uniref:tRNA-specific 2-thiouridylase MnmA n=1 Tax=uncultured bacterium A1Q1_fos_568 TaxID=1256586 RepID=L7VVX0_9BACT|nr:tRNA (5-methylaminomethyl-2-thiouridylate)-methyltransferase [uncultured bacterium A1Q1_fos_568]